jgi:hypothetical protein
LVRTRPSQARQTVRRSRPERVLTVTMGSPTTKTSASQACPKKVFQSKLAAKRGHRNADMERSGFPDRTEAKPGCSVLLRNALGKRKTAAYQGFTRGRSLIKNLTGLPSPDFPLDCPSTPFSIPGTTVGPCDAISRHFCHFPARSGHSARLHVSASSKVTACPLPSGNPPPICESETADSPQEESAPESASGRANGAGVRPSTIPPLGTDPCGAT